MKLSRRTLLVSTLAGLTTLGLTKLRHVIGLNTLILNNKIPGELAGASSTLGHRLNQHGTFPKVAQAAQNSIVIVGGGIAGLAAGYRLLKAGVHDFVVLDLEKHVGGNAQSGQNAICAYPWGAHYVPLLTEDARCVRRLFEELGIITAYNNANLPVYNEFYICNDPNERLYLYGRWQDGLLPVLGASEQDKTQYRDFLGLMHDYKNRKGKDGKRLFAIPVDASSRDREWLSLDNITMLQWLDEHGFTSKPLHWYVNYCCRDDFGTTLETTSAWAGIHYFASRSGLAANTEADSVITWPEGNGWLSKKLSERIRDNILTQSLCYQVNDDKGSLTVDYWDEAKQQSRRIAAQAVIMATPRFIATKLIQSDRQHFSAEGFSYSPWAVANISLNRLPTGKGAPLSWDNVVFESQLLGYVNATHQITQMNPVKTVLTYYWPLTHTAPAQARQEALARTLSDWQSVFLTELLRIHPELTDHVQRVDIWLWGHGMIRPTPGFIWGSQRQAALTQTPPIFTAHSDMSGISLFEEAYSHGIAAAENALTYLNLAYQSEL